MRPFNFLYIFVPLVFAGLIVIPYFFDEHTVSFSGFAENQETEVNVDYPVRIQKILVQPGDRVKAGQPLMEVQHRDLAQEIEDINATSTLSEMQFAEAQKELDAKIEANEVEKKGVLANIELQLSLLRKEKVQKSQLWQGLNSVKRDSTLSDPIDLKIERLELERNQVAFPYDTEIRQLRAEKLRVSAPLSVLKDRYNRRKTQIDTELKKFSIVAPTDGLIGNIPVKEGEFIDEYGLLISFYEPNPTLVDGYVHEQLLLQVHVGDSVQVMSTFHPDLSCTGIITGLGSRIVEIPERLRKYPEIKTYGREVLIKIPNENPLLQKEKVILNLRTN